MSGPRQPQTWHHGVMTAKAVHVARCTGTCTLLCMHSPPLPGDSPTCLVGPLPASKDGFTHLFTIVDRTTRWPEAILLKNTTAADCVSALTSGWIAHFGVRSIITSDRGVQFTSQILQVLCNTLRIKYVVTTAYHPQSNGLVEHFNRQLKNALKACACGVDWAEHLPWVMLGIGAAPKEDSVVSAAEMVFGSPLTLPGQILTEEDVPADSTRERAGLAVKQFVAASRSYVEVASGIPGTLAEAEMVYVRVERSARRSRRATAALTGYWSAGPWFSTFRWETKRR